MMNFKKIIISRTDAIGDVVLCLPVAGVLKELYPECKIVFLGRTYTKPIINACKHIDEFIDWDELRNSDEKNCVEKFKAIHADAIIHIFPRKEIAKAGREAEISFRFGTTNRIYHWNTCNKLMRLSRKNSPYHEAQLNLKLLKPFAGKKSYTLKEIPQYYGLTKIKSLREDVNALIDKTKFNLILHPKSKGSAREWGLDNFAELIRILPVDRFKIFLTGTEEEGLLIRKSLVETFPHITDLTGKLTIDELLSFISSADGIVAASTGPLHIAAALGKHAIGIYPPIRPMHPGRWAPLGENALYLVEDKPCSKCRKNNDCECIRNIKPESIKKELMRFL